MPSVGRLFMHVLDLFFGRTITQGADTAIWVASSQEVEGISSGFFDQRKRIKCKFKNLETEEKLWTICEGLISST